MTCSITRSLRISPFPYKLENPLVSLRDSEKCETHRSVLMQGMSPPRLLSMLTKGSYSAPGCTDHRCPRACRSRPGPPHDNLSTSILKRHRQSHESRFVLLWDFTGGCPKPITQSPVAERGDIMTVPYDACYRLVELCAKPVLATYPGTSCTLN